MHEKNGLPKAIILHTKKGHGCSIAEGVEANHHMRFKKEDMEKALESAEDVLVSVKSKQGGQKG